MADRALLDAFRFFRDHAGYVVGRAAECALDLARAELEARDRDWVCTWEDDPEPYDPGDTDDQPSEVLGCVLWPDLDTAERKAYRRALASLWGIGDPSREYMRVVEAELASEALAELDKRERAEQALRAWHDRHFAL